MKTFLLICSTLFMASTAFSATYEVPVAFGLKRFAKFELKNFEKSIEGDQVVVKYDLPQVLTGNLEHIEMKGSTVKGTKDLMLVGDKGIANCSSDEYVTCKIEYYNLNIDTEKATDKINGISINRLEKALRMRVMRSFSGDPVGIVKY